MDHILNSGGLGYLPKWFLLLQHQLQQIICNLQLNNNVILRHSECLLPTEIGLSELLDKQFEEGFAFQFELTDDLEPVELLGFGEFYVGEGLAEGHYVVAEDGVELGG